MKVCETCNRVDKEKMLHVLEKEVQLCLKLDYSCLLSIFVVAEP